MASGGFTVTPSQLYRASGDFKDGGEAILAARKLFAAAALPESAFGNLPQSKQIASQYERFVRQVGDDLAKLAEALLDGTAKLALSATLYRVAGELAAAHAQLPASQAEAIAQQLL